jgi:hypothetical protein
MAVAAGHATVEAFLRALRPPQLTLTHLYNIMSAAHDSFPAAEEAAAADLFYSFAPRGGGAAEGRQRGQANPAIFHPSLLEAAPPFASYNEADIEDLLPMAVSKWFPMVHMSK